MVGSYDASLCLGLLLWLYFECFLLQLGVPSKVLEESHVSM